LDIKKEIAFDVRKSFSKRARHGYRLFGLARHRRRTGDVHHGWRTRRMLAAIAARLFELRDLAVVGFQQREQDAALGGR
jgi:hypothetical protein